MLYVFSWLLMTALKMVALIHRSLSVKGLKQPGFYVILTNKAERTIL